MKLEKEQSWNLLRTFVCITIAGTLLHGLFDLWPSIFDTIWLYFQLLTPADMLKDMWMSAIFMLLGLWISWDRIRRNAYTDLHGASSVMETLSYLPGREPQTAAEPLEEADGPVIQAVEFSAPEQPL